MTRLARVSEEPLERSTHGSRDVEHRPQGAGRRHGIAGSHEDPCDLPGGIGDAADERGLADAGLASDEDEAALPGRRLGNEAVELREEGLPLQQLHVTRPAGAGSPGPRAIRRRQHRPARWAPQRRHRIRGAWRSPLSARGPRDEGAPAQREPEREVRRPRDPDPAARGHVEARGPGWRVDAERPPPEIPPVVAEGDAQGLGEAGRAAGQGGEGSRGRAARGRMPAAARHRFHPAGGARGLG